MKSGRSELSSVTRGAGREKAGHPGTPKAGIRNGSGDDRLHFAVHLLLIGLAVPFVIHLGPIRLSAYRIVLLITILPCLLTWLSGRAGRIRLPDIAILLMVAWSALSFTVIHGLNVSTEASGILFVETVGAYFLARCLIRTAEQFRRMVRVLFLIILSLLPLALFETLSGRAIALEVANAIAPSYEILDDLESRYGLRRAQGPFEHPILFGVFCGSLLGLTLMVLGYGRSFLWRASTTALVGVTGALSLSSGPLAAMLLQALLIGWNTVLRSVMARWKILVGLGLSAVILVEIVAERSTPQIFLSYFAFNPSTAFNRLRIWEYGSASVLKHPFLGIGLNEWERPSWMLGSIDMFWLVPAVRHGLPSALLLQLAFFSILLGVVLKKGLDARQSDYRLGYAISMIGIYLAGWGVHYWDATYVLLMFLMGSGVWMLDAVPQTPPEPVRRRRLWGVETRNTASRAASVQSSGSTSCSRAAMANSPTRRPNGPSAGNGITTSR